MHHDFAAASGTASRRATAGSGVARGSDYALPRKGARSALLERCRARRGPRAIWPGAGANLGRAGLADGGGGWNHTAWILVARGPAVRGAGDFRGTITWHCFLLGAIAPRR